MNVGKKSVPNSHLTCDVCKIDFNSNADFVLHEFSKKHCDNLIRLSKQKPVTSKQKTKNDVHEVEKPSPKVNTVTHSGSFAKYGYFVPGEVYVSSEVSKEFNTEYDPYLQKFAENPFKEKPSPKPQHEMQTFHSVTSFKKVKKKKIKTCQVCNVTLVTLPEYESHMKSPQHIWKLKITGMGVSAHFVKASTDLHTTDINEEVERPNKDEEMETTSGTPVTADDSSSVPFPLLYCSDCELLLNSPQQYNTHISGKSHSECAQKKAELKAKKERLENPPSNQLFCYSCKISLNNLYQYNEHKSGKKHKTRCRVLIKRGITIPPEERFPGLPHPNPNKPVVYPELYEKFLLEREKPNCMPQNPVQSNSLNIAGYSQINSVENLGAKENCDFKNEAESSQYSIQCDKIENPEQSYFTTSITQPDINLTSQNGRTSESSKNFNKLEIANTNAEIPNCQNTTLKSVEPPQLRAHEEGKEELINNVTIIYDKSLTCSICRENFDWQAQLDNHLSTEEHLKQILEFKLSGRSDCEILNDIFSDRRVVKPSQCGKFSCSICNVTTDSSLEFTQHLTSIVHKYTEKDYQNKKTIEVKNIIKCNENGLYFCKLCQEGWMSLVEYTQHLHFVKHKSIQRAHRAKVISQKRKNHKQGLQRMKNLSVLRIKNPGVRTKICGVATDLCTGAQAQIPNLEPLEPKIDNDKNVSIGVSDQANKSDNNSKPPKMKRRVVKPRNRSRYPFIPPGSLMPPPMPCIPFGRSPSPGFMPNNRIRFPFSSPRPPFGPFCGVPPVTNSHFRPQRFSRPPWPRNRLRYTY